MSLYYGEDAATVHHGDCIEVMRTLPDNSVDSIVTDPPYGLSSTSPERVTEAIVAWATGDRDYIPAGKGFMGKSWDAFVPPPALWDEAMRVLKPGGHLLAFAGTRTQDLMGLSIRLAGFEIRENLAWLYGSGFPKSLDVSKAIDKAAGAERTEKIGERGLARWKTGAPGGAAMKDDGGIRQDFDKVNTLLAPATPAAQQWQGWGTALKPAHEPIVCAQKPFNVVPLDVELNRLVHLLGAITWTLLSHAKRAEVSSASSQAEPGAARCASALATAATLTSPEKSAKTDMFNSPALASTFSNIAASWSSISGALSAQTKTSTTSTKSSTTTDLKTLNSLLAQIISPTTMPPCECRVNGSTSNVTNAATTSTDEWAHWMHTLNASVPETAIEGIAHAAASALARFAATLSDDQGAASSADDPATTSAVAKFEPIVMARKPLIGTVAANVQTHGTGALNIDATRIGAPAGRWPANVALDEHMAAVLDGQSGVSVSTAHTRGKQISGQHGGMAGAEPEYKDGIVATVRGMSDSGGASRFFYVAKAPKKERPVVDDIAHATVKPLALMRWLVRLVTPEGGTVLEPFAGSGTTVEACMMEGLHCIAIEQEAEYLPLIQARIDRQEVA